MNKLFYGDNLAVLREHIASDSVDLIYLDPPFNSNANYNILFKSKTGDGSDAQIEAFEDEWGRTYPKLQIITLAELFQGKKPDIPFVDPASVKRAKWEDGTAGKQENLL